MLNILIFKRRAIIENIKMPIVKGMHRGSDFWKKLEGLCSKDDEDFDSSLASAPKGEIARTEATENIMRLLYQKQEGAKLMMLIALGVPIPQDMKFDSPCPDKVFNQQDMINIVKIGRIIWQNHIGIGEIGPDTKYLIHCIFSAGGEKDRMYPNILESVQQRLPLL